MKVEIIMAVLSGIVAGIYMGYDWHRRVEWPKRMDEIANRIVARCKEAGIKIVDDEEFSKLVKKHHGGYQ